MIPTDYRSRVSRIAECSTGQTAAFSTIIILRLWVVCSGTLYRERLCAILIDIFFVRVSRFFLGLSCIAGFLRDLIYFMSTSLLPRQTMLIFITTAIRMCLIHVKLFVKKLPSQSMKGYDMIHYSPHESAYHTRVVFIFNFYWFVVCALISHIRVPFCLLKILVMSVLYIAKRSFTASVSQPTLYDTLPVQQVLYNNLSLYILKCRYRTTRCWCRVKVEYYHNCRVT